MNNNFEVTKIRSRAPLRLGLAGGASDVSPYCDLYGGNVLNATVNLYAYCFIEASKDGCVHFATLDNCEEFSCPDAETIEAKGPLKLHKAVYNRVVRDFTNGKRLPVRLRTASDAPPGSGLGASSTLVVAMLAAYTEWLKLPLGDYDLAHLAYEIERRDLGLVGGRQDQYAATFGGVNFMEFYGDDRVVVNPLRIKQAVMRELESSIILFYTGLSRESAEVITEQIQNVTARDSDAINATHELKKDAVLMKEALLKGNIPEITRVLGRSWDAKKRIARSVTNPMVDEIYETAMRAGALAGRISGAGGGGFIIFMVDPVRKFQVIKALRNCCGSVYPVQFVEHGVHAWSV